MSLNGAVLRGWGAPGDGPGQFSFNGDPSDVNARIAVGADGTVYVSDSGNARIEVFRPTGEFIRQLGRFGSDEGQFLRLSDVAVDREGNVYAADDQLSTVSKFDSDGRFLWPIGGSGTDFEEPHLGNVDVHGRLVMLNGAGTVFFIDGDGRTVESFQARGCDVSVDDLGNVYVNRDVDGCDAGLTQVFDRTHELVGEWSGSDDTLATPILFAPNGDAFAISTWNPEGRGAAIVRMRISLPEG